MNIYIENKMFFEHIKYSFETLFRCIGLKDVVNYLDINDNKSYFGIYYGKKCPNKFKGIYIYEGNLFGDKYLKNESIPKFPLKQFQGFPVLFSDSSDICCIEDKNLIIINIDIVQSTFFCVTGYEEIVDNNHRDLHSRYEQENKILFFDSQFNKPVVNIYAKLLKNKLDLIFRNLQYKKYTPYALVSHDVDVPYETHGLYMVNSILNKIGLKAIKKISRGFDIIKCIESKYQINSSWYFKSGCNNRSYDYFYDLQDKSIINCIDKLRNYGDEIGWHYSYNAAFDKYQFSKEYNLFSAILKTKKIFGRNHYLRYDIPISWQIYSNNKVYYDSTLATELHPGFLYGIATPFELFDAVNGKNLHVWEIPLIIMEGTLMSNKKHYYGFDEIINIVDYYLNIVKEYKGVFTILWHNNNLGGFYWKKYVDIYKLLMQKVSKMYVCKTGCEIIDYYCI